MRTGFMTCWLAATLALSLSACGENTPQSAQQQAPQVGYITVQAKTVTLNRELPGRTSAHQVAEVRPQVSGIVQQRLFDEGQQVEAGQPLYQLDNRTYLAEVANAKAAVSSAEATLRYNTLRSERMQKLIGRKAVSQQEYDEALAVTDESRAALAAAKARLQTARINLDYATIKAPISGRIGRSNITAGALVTANQATALATIRELDPVYVDLTQSSTEMHQLRQAMANGELQKISDDQARVTLYLEDGSAYEHAGTLQFSEYAVDESTGSVTLRALFPNPDSELLPGMFVRARLPEGLRHNTILVPQKAVTRDPTGQATAMVVDSNNTAQLVTVVAERAIKDQWLISAGLESGDRLIIDGLQLVRPGAPVNPVDTQAQAAASSTQPAAQ